MKFPVDHQSCSWSLTDTKFKIAWNAATYENEQFQPSLKYPALNTSTYGKWPNGMPKATSDTNTK